MTGEITVTGMVIISAPVNEYDKRVVLLTKERGKITAFAKGAKKPKSQFCAVTRQFAFGEFTLYEGKTAYNMVSAKITNYFEEIMQDITLISYGCYFLEIAEYFSQENMEAKDTLLFVYQALRALIHPSMDNQLVRRVFELKMLVLQGIYPDFFQCCKCGKEEKLNGFSIVHNGMLCEECNAKDKIMLTTSTVYALQYIVSSEIGKVFDFHVSEEVQTELDILLNRFYAIYVDKKIQSLLMLE